MRRNGVGRNDRGAEGAEEEEEGSGQAELLTNTDRDYFLKNISVEKIHHYTQKNGGKIISSTSATISVKYQRYGEIGDSSREY